MSAPQHIDPVAADLAAIRERAESGSTRQIVTDDLPRLLAAIEKVLELAHPGPICVGDELVRDWTLDPAAVREAITRELSDYRTNLDTDPEGER